MAELEARYESNAAFGWRLTLPVTPVVIGRIPGEGGWATEWDNFISRQHATLAWEGSRLHVTRNPKAGNPIFYKNVPSDDFTVGNGESFRIGNTVFTVHDEATPIEVTLAVKDLHQIRFDNADQRILALASLPEIIRQSGDEKVLEQQVCESLLRGIPHGDVAGVVRVLPNSNDEELRVAVCSFSRRGMLTSSSPAEFHPSRRLVHDAVRRRLSTLHVWNKDPARDAPDSKFSLTDPGTDWALCTPLLEEASAGYALYVAGRLARDLRTSDSVHKDTELKADLRFTRLTADIFGALHQVHHLQSRQSLLLRFLSPRVVRVLMAETHRTVDEVLEAKPADVTVLFCDLRGSCRIAEEGRDNLEKLWECVGEALGVMTDAIVQFDGVVGDFQGDAAMGFWGWPLSTEDQIEQACRAALSIRRHFALAASKKSSMLAGFACGLGLAHGRAIAGRLGTIDQFKVGVFGPVVNLAARLESMTKLFRVPILVDEAVADHVRAHRSAGWARARRVAKVKPAGMATPVLVNELLPPVGSDALPEQKRMDYESAFDAFLANHWPDARNLLRFLTHDGPSDFLLDFLNRHPDGPPEGWDGVIALEKK
jgi:adenylate cyclase